VTGVAAGTATITATAQGASGTASVTVANATGGTRCATSNAISTITPTTAGTTINGALTSTDCTLSDGTFADIYRLTVTVSTPVQIDLTSTAFDAYLVLFDASLGGVAEDDDSGGGTNSRITRTLAPGTYYIAANAFDVGVTGAYSLTVKIP
jgi:hypothetical protein